MLVLGLGSTIELRAYDSTQMGLGEPLARPEKENSCKSLPSLLLTSAHPLEGIFKSVYPWTVALKDGYRMGLPAYAPTDVMLTP